ncbi:MAG: DUF427 domain-containing protein [Acidimicrobiia bacterium]|nr:DUF427 domain-containing protein [Acidimicrobiia bacterium]MBT8248130.1 DUF427 domain-containing protein [Acidimicrobiia bacterium]NNF88050.1 DUF427 domain-containing protein [Acidimicrobiia bacterium]NNJ47354.1 DUF427 domain-containing protein [Acidimicrobiia bacterium]NNL14962.1 DUF427 domain-containing protein [Acidimicrobiia bacterium]
MKRIEPGPGQESVWDYPRPPRVEPSQHQVRVEFGGREIARSDRAVRVLETSHPPVFYVPLDDIVSDVIELTQSSSFCEFKGSASYYTIRVGEQVSVDAAWTYLDPSPSYETLTGLVAFYPGRVDACFVGEERVEPQAGDFYGGWITKSVVGPFKGAPGTMGW